MNKFSTIIFVALLCIQAGNSENILFYFAVSSYSHRIAVWPLVEALAEKGHSVTFLSPFSPKDPNPKVTEFIPTALSTFMKSIAGSMLDARIKGNQNELWTNFPSLGLHTCKLVVQSEEIRDLTIHSKFDLVVIDALYNECGLGLAYLFDAKVMYFATASPYIWIADLLGHIPETSWVPDVRSNVPQQMTFLEKVKNTLWPLYAQFYVKQWQYFPQLEKLLKAELNVQNMPSLTELEKTLMVYLVNTHYSIEYARSLPPVYVPIGGLQIKEARGTLPPEMSKFVSESGKGGVVYISFGSFAEVSDFPKDVLQIFVRVLASFPSVRFVWKSDMEKIPGMSANVMTAKWVPQADLLSHKSVRGFITHGGLLSIQEATNFGIPLIVFPMFADQDYNAEIIHRTECGIRLEIAGITEDALRNAISQITENSKYKEKMMEISTAFRDRPATPLETAVWWTEYCLRHKNTSFLKPLGIHQTWYEGRLLDVWLFLFSIVFGTGALLAYITCWCFTKVFKKTVVPPAKKLKKR